MRAWIKIATIAAALVCAFAPLDPWVIERWYSTWLYPLLQRTLTPISNLFPFALFDVMTITAVVAVLLILVRGVRRARREKRWSLLLHTLLTLATGASVAYLLFLFCWGLNYRRVAMSQRLVLDEEGANSEAALSLGLRAVEQLNALYAPAHAAAEQPTWLDSSLREAFSRVQGFLSDASPAVPGRLKPTLYGPYFRWTSVDGMVDPFALEVMANPDLLPIERPFVAAHEWSHLAGYADESEASFVGWLTCVRAGPAAQYSGWLFLYRELSGQLSRRDREQLAARLDEGPRSDLDAIALRVRQGRWPWLSRSSWRVYDQYLKANRVEAGVRSYDLVVTLLLRARFEEGWKPVRRSSS